jgi:hypothetical protein
MRVLPDCHKQYFDRQLCNGKGFPVMRLKQFVGPIAAFCIIWLAFAVLTYYWLLPLQINFDFYARWAGAREMLHGNNPYLIVFDKAFFIDRGIPEFMNQHFLYPATITWILLPFWFIPMHVAVSLWCGLILLQMFALPLQTFLIFEWQPRPWMVALLTFAVAFGDRYTMSVYEYGQFIAFILSCLVLAWAGLAANRPWLVAIALVGATLRPDGIVMVAAFLLDLLVHHRYRILALWTGIMGSLFLLSVAWIGWWIPDFIDGIGMYENKGISSYPTLSFNSRALAAVIIVVVVAWGLNLLWRMRTLPDRTRIPWSLSVVILMVLIIMPQTHDYTLLYAMLPLLVMLWAGRDSKWTLPVVLVCMGLSWLPEVEDNLQFCRQLQLLNPALLGVLLTYYWFRWTSLETVALPQKAALPQPG